jgi:hypothetical protein
MSYPLPYSQEPSILQNPPQFPSLQQKAVKDKTSSNCVSELPIDSNERSRMVANNPSTPPEELRKLADSSDAITRSHIAANPNTPTEVLLLLCAEFPAQVLNNPILSLLFLENPNVFNTIPLDSLLILLQQEKVPVFFLEWAATQPKPEIQLAVAMNAQTPKPILEKFVDSQWSKIAEAARLHVNLAGEMLEGWDEAARAVVESIDIIHIDWVYLEKLAKVGLIPDFAIKLLLRNLPQHELYCLKVLKTSATSAHTAPSALEQLTKYNYWEIRSAVACNLRTPANILTQLASDRDWLVREAVAYNPRTPTRILAQLANDSDWLVRNAVSCNPSTPIQLREQLMPAQHRLVRCNSIHHNLSTHHTLSTSSKTLATLFLEIIEKSQTHASFISTPLLSRFIILLHPQTPDEILVENCRSFVWLERYAIARNTSTPLKTLKSLAKDANRIVCAAAKANLGIV